MSSTRHTACPILRSRWVHGPVPRHRPLAACPRGPRARRRRSAPPQCWTPEALAGTPAEIKHQRSKGPLDVAALKATPLPPATPVEPALRGLIESVALPPDKKLIALTFDLCEESGYVSGYDGRIVDLLRAEGIKATFFAGGKWMETHPERAAQLIADPLFEVGSHGLKHVDLSRANEAVIKDEVTLTEAAYARAKTGLAARQCLVVDTAPSPPERLTVFRFPYGRCNAKALAAVDDAGLLAIQWDVVTGDPDPRVSAKTIARTILARAHPGAIVVGHANGRGTQYRRRPRPRPAQAQRPRL